VGQGEYLGLSAGYYQLSQLYSLRGSVGDCTSRYNLRRSSFITAKAEREDITGIGPYQSITLFIVVLPCIYCLSVWHTVYIPVVIPVTTCVRNWIIIYFIHTSFDGFYIPPLVFACITFDF